MRQHSKKTMGLTDDSSRVSVTIPHLIINLLVPPRGGFLAELLRQERKTGEVENGNERSPNVEHNIGRFGQGVPTGSHRVLRPVSNADLGEGQDDDDNSEEYVEVVLYRTASGGGFGLEPMDDVADENLDDIEDEDRESEARVGVKEVRTTTVGDGRNPESETNDDNRTGNVELDGLMSLEPNGSRSPEVTRDQSTQGQQKQKSDDADNSMGDDHSVILSEGQ